MLTLILILNILNIGGLLTAGVLYFKETYTIVRIEQWNEIANIYNEAVSSGLVTEEGEVATPIATDNVGFFKEYIDEPMEEQEEEE